MSDDNSGSTIELNRRRVLGALGVVGAASAGAGAGTFALFSDTETSSGNSVQAGTLDLEVDSGSTLPIDVTDAQPGDGQRRVATLNNIGSLSGSLDVGIGTASANEGQNPESEPSSYDGSLTFRVPYAYDQDGFWKSRYQFSESYSDPSPPEDPILLSDVGLSPIETTVDTSGSEHVATVELPKPIESGDSVELHVDEGNTGTLDYYIGRDSSGNYYKKPSGGTFNVSPTSGTPSDYSVTTSNGGATIEFTRSGSGDFAVSGVGEFDPTNFGGLPSDKAGDLLLSLTPGARYTEASFGTVNYGTTSTREIPFDGSLPNLVDLLEAEVVVYDDYTGSDASGTVLAQGLLGRIDDQDFDLNKQIANGGSADVVVNVDISRNVGNVIQGDSATFSLEFELNQEDSQ